MIAFKLKVTMKTLNENQDFEAVLFLKGVAF
jgi:hypothetical protein